MFVEREAGRDIYVGDGALLKRSIADGDSVTLETDGCTVSVREIAQVSPGKYVGTIYGFEPGIRVEFNGLKIDQRIEFSERHILTCSA